MARLFSRKTGELFQYKLRSEAFEKSADGIFVLSAEKIVDANPAALRFLRCPTKEEILSISPPDLSPEFQPDGRRSADAGGEILAIAAKEGHARFEWFHRRLDGSTFPVLVSLVCTGRRKPPPEAGSNRHLRPAETATRGR